MSIFAPAPKPKSLLGYQRILSPTAGVRVSPLCLGAMNFGDAWKDYLGVCTKETSFEMLDYFFENGGNFIDTANNYQSEESETWIGEWMKQHGNRDQMVVATKFTTCYPSGKGGETIKANFQGNHSKSLHLSVRDSLRKLQTEYIDLLYIHWWDFSTSIEEVMKSLHALVLAGKVLYLGISDTPAWIVSRANQYARDHALTPFVVYQGHWSAAFRDMEREIIPMCEAEGMAIAPWGALGRGMFKSEEEWNNREDGRKMGPQSEKHKKVALTLEKLAKKKDTLITSVALAYVLHKTPYVFPIVGGRNVKHLKGNVEALAVQLTDEEIDEIDQAEPFDIGFPLNFVFGGGKQYSNRLTTKDMFLVRSATRMHTVEKPRPIQAKHDEE